MEQATQENPSYIIVDTCIIQHGASSKKTKSEAVISCLEGLSKKGYKLAISEITLYEKLHGLWGRRAEETVKILKTYEWKTVSTEVLLMSSMLGGLYIDLEVDKERISIGDKIIAATAILEKCFVLTENHKDFIYPIFNMNKPITIKYQIGHYYKSMDFALYRPNLEYINRKIFEYQDPIS